MMKKLAFSFCLLTFAFHPPVFAQVGNCEPALGEAMLDAGNVRARILNNGGLFWRRSPHVYEAPKGSGKNAIFAAGIWIAGSLDGKIRGAASRYGPYEFWAGPLDEAGNPPADCLLYDKIWEIRRTDLVRFLHEGHVSDNLRNWPWQLGAPVIDGDGNASNYNLEGGDLPELFGDQRLWWVMNDRGNAHEATRSEPIGLEVHGSAHAFTHPGFGGNITFYDYKFINKNQHNLSNAYMAVFMDVDLGNFDDDYIGSDSLLHLGYVYNADNMDEGREGYGIAPPALGVTYLQSAIADSDGHDNDRDGEIDEPGETIGASGFMTYASGGDPTGDPHKLSDYYNFMQSRWKDGVHMTKGGIGRDVTTVPIKFAFPGDPVSGNGWTEFNPDPFTEGYIPIPPSDRRSLTSSGPFNITSNDTLHVRFAIVWSRGSNNLDSVTELKKDVAKLHISPETFYSFRPIAPPTEIPPSYVLGFNQNFPNPFSESTSLSYSLPKSMRVRLAVHDILGREVELLVDQQQDAGIYNLEFEAGNLPAGIYLARIELDHLRFTKRMVLMR